MESSAISPMDSHQGRISTDYSREAELDRLLIAEPSKMKEEQKAVSYTHLTLPTIYSV